MAQKVLLYAAHTRAKKKKTLLGKIFRSRITVFKNMGSVRLNLNRLEEFLGHRILVTHYSLDGGKTILPNPTDWHVVSGNFTNKNY